MNETQDATLLEDLIRAVIAAGADAADARLARSASLSVEVRNAQLENIEREESRMVALRAFFGRRQAHVSGSDLSPEGLRALSERAAFMARLAPEDPFCGLIPPEELARERPDLDLDCDDLADAASLERRAAEGEAAALSVAGVRQVSHAGASWVESRYSLAASNGFFASKSSGLASVSVVAIAEQDGAMERDYDSWSHRRKVDAMAPHEIGLSAGRRAAARLGAHKIESRTANVIFDNRVAVRLLGAFVGAVSGPAVARGVSFLKDRLGKAVFAPGVAVIDDPLTVGGWGSRAFDGEGRAVQRRAVIEDGRLTQFLLNTPSARQLGMTPNGFASLGFGDPPGIATSNLNLQPGVMDLPSLMREAGEGLLVCDMFGPSLNPNTGDYSVGVSGFWFEGGEMAYPVSEITVAGDLPSMFRRAVPGADLVIRSSTNAPSVLIGDLALAGR